MAGFTKKKESYHALVRRLRRAAIALDLRIPLGEITPEMVMDSYRAKIKAAHPDSGEQADVQDLNELRKAKDTLINDLGDFK